VGRHFTGYFAFIYLFVGEDVNQAEIIISQEDFEEALANLTPSLTDAEIQRYRHMRECISNDKSSQIHDKLVTGQLLPDV
jgi:hypothetical protein